MYTSKLISSYLFENLFWTLAKLHTRVCEHWQTDFSEIDWRVCCRARMIIEEWVGFQHRADPMRYEKKEIEFTGQGLL